MVTKSLKDFFWSYAGWQLGTSNPDGWAALIKYMVDSGQLDQTVTPADILNNDYVAKYNQFDANAIKNMIEELLNEKGDAASGGNWHHRDF